MKRISTIKDYFQKYTFYNAEVTLESMKKEYLRVFGQDIGNDYLYNAAPFLNYLRMFN